MHRLCGNVQTGSAAPDYAWRALSSRRPPPVWTGGAIRKSTDVAVVSSRHHRSRVPSMCCKSYQLKEDGHEHPRLARTRRTDRMDGLIMLTHAQQEGLLNVVVGIGGAALSGWFLSPLVGVSAINQGTFNAHGLFAATR